MAISALCRSTLPCYNQIANFVLVQSEINIGIGDKAPEAYFAEFAEQCDGGPERYGGITEPEEMRANLRMSCLSERLLNGDIQEFDGFLEQHRKLMAQKNQDLLRGALR